MRYNEQVDYEQVVLDWVKYHAQQTFSREFLAHTRFDVSDDMLRCTITAHMTKCVLRRKVMEDRTLARVTGKLVTTDLPTQVMVELPNNWWRRWWRLPTRKLWLDVIGNAAYLELADEVPVSGVADVRADYFDTFPEPINYPDWLGVNRPVIIPVIERTHWELGHGDWPHI